MARSSGYTACDAVRLTAGAACSGRTRGQCTVHLRLVVEVVVGHLRVVGRRRDHDEPERGPGGRRGRPAVDVMRQREPGGDVDVRRVDLDGWQVVESDGGFERPGLGLEDDSVGGRHDGVPRGAGGQGAAATRAIVTSYSRTASARVR